MELRLATLRRKKVTILNIYYIPYIILSASLSIVLGILLKERDTVLMIYWAVMLSIIVILGNL
jgi:hypothetical protein